MLTGPILLYTLARYVLQKGIRLNWKYMKSDMDKKKAFDSSSQWISDEQRIHETSDYGRNKKAVEDALSEQQRRVKLVKEYSGDVQKAQAAAKSTSQREQVGEAYTELQDVASHRLGCLQDIAQIASLEDVFNMLSIEFAQRATSLVADACSEATVEETKPAENGASGSDGIARAAQSCILAVRNNWNWISKLVKCADVHLKHVSEYHQFFHEGKEYDKWMPAELSQHISSLEAASHDENDGQRLLSTLKETLAIFLHWQNKINDLFEKSRKIVPVHFRTKPLDHYRPVTSLCDYKTNEIEIQEGEELTLIDNSKPQIWLVRNMHATESQVPSVICVIPGPDSDAVTLATRLRIQLLKTWTVCLKQVGKVVILFFTLIFKNLDPAIMKKLRCLTDDDKIRVIQAMQWIIDTFSKYWSDDPSFRSLMINLRQTRDTVNENGDSSDYDVAFNKEYITRVRCIEDILTHFRNYLRQWETYKLLSEASRQSDYMLMVENWEQLKYFQTDEILRKVNLGLEGGSYGSGSSEERWKYEKKSSQNGGGSNGSGGSEVITQKITTTTNMPLEGQMDRTDFSETTETMTTVTETSRSSNGSATLTDEYHKVATSAETEQLMHAEQEERKKFIITGVIDPSSGEEVSFDKAIKLGIIDQNNGTYILNRKTRQSIPIPEAMNTGKIIVEFTSTKKTAEKKSDVGLITVSTQKESRPYSVKAVVDAMTEEHLSIDDAMLKGVLNQQKGTVTNTLLNKEMSLSDAIDSGLLIVEFDEDCPDVAEPEVVTITYAIHAVVDARAKDKVSFSVAVRRGLIDKETGAYFHNVKLENIYIIDAIKRGFIKATIVEDPSAMDIAPENKMVVDKVNVIRKKLINPLKTIAAMRGAVEESREAKDGK